MTKLLAIVAMLATPAILPMPEQSERVDKLAVEIKKALAKCEAPVNIEFCEITVITRGWEKKGPTPKTKQLRIYSSAGAPTVSRNSSDVRNRRQNEKR